MRTENAVIGFTGIEVEVTREEVGTWTVGSGLCSTSGREVVEDDASMHTFTCFSTSYSPRS